jgi:hypothetical protein
MFNGGVLACSCLQNHSSAKARSKMNDLSTESASMFWNSCFGSQPAKEHDLI